MKNFQFWGERSSFYMTQASRVFLFLDFIFHLDFHLDFVANLAATDEIFL